ncbi:unnamed protein product, partial [Heterotrigona itama]
CLVLEFDFLQKGTEERRVTNEGHSRRIEPELRLKGVII